jgi:phage shock protein C
MSKQSAKTNSFKRLYLSSEDRKISGVCGGLGEYFEADPTLIRLGWIILTLATGIVPGIIAYFIAALIIPKHAEEGK